jgi:hypothetical protein
MTYSIGIVTYVRRFERYFKPLLEGIQRGRPGIEITVCVNGEHCQPFDQKYRCEILRYLAQFDNVFPMVFTQFRSLAKLWNTCVWNATNDHIFILNDDVSIDSDFYDTFEEKIKDGRLTFKINNSYSHFSVSRLELDAIGWFDERLLGVGEEDGDMQLRWEETFKRPFESVRMGGITNHFEQDECQIGIRKVNNKYSAFNRNFMRAKYDFAYTPPRPREPHINPCPVERFFWGNKVNL